MIEFGIIGEVVDALNYQRRQRRPQSSRIALHDEEACPFVDSSAKKFLFSNAVSAT